MKKLRYLLVSLCAAGVIGIGCGDDNVTMMHPDAGGNPDGAMNPDGPNPQPTFVDFVKDLINNKTADNTEPVDFVNMNLADSEDPTAFDSLFP
jgi:hypothetical protein